MRLGWGRTSAAAVEEVGGPSADQAPYELAAIELLTEEGCFVGWIATEGERTSDWLNQHAELPIHDLAPRDEGAAPQPPQLSAASAQPFSRDRVIWAVPPPLPPNRHLRLHRRRMLVHLELDDYEVSGQVHVRPGADAADHLIRGTREMIPLTDVQVSSRAKPREGASLPVLIINRAHVRRIIAEHSRRPSPVAVPEVVPAAAPEVAPEVTPGATPEVAIDEPQPASAAVSPIESGLDLVQAALGILLETEVIDVVEFQSIRARMAQKAADGSPAD